MRPNVRPEDPTTPLKGLLADANCEGQFTTLIRLMDVGYRWLYWDSLQLEVFWLTDVGMESATPDRVVWETCQREGLVLVTANRNQDGEDSLESAIHEQNDDQSLPVITIGDVERVSLDPDYADRAADRLLVYLFEMERYLGAGRLYVP